MLIPPSVIRIRQDICERAKCTANSDFANPCASCPGHWGAYTKKGCDGSMPSLLHQAKSLGQAAVQVVKHGAAQVSSDEQVRRLAICGTCEHFLPEQGRCKLCGCHLAFKTRLAAWHCPISRW